jgi:parvulin-like peptidyl-prolyl isomerase
MLYSTRARRHEQKGCCGRFLYEPGLFAVKRAILVLFGLLLVLAVTACGGSGPKSVPSDAVAVVGSKSINKSDWDALMNQTKQNYKATNHAFPKAGSVELANLRSNVTQFLISASEYEQEAAKLGVTVTDKDVNDRLNQIKQQYYGSTPGQKTPSKAEIEKRYQAALKQQGFTDAQVRQGIKLTLIREKVQAKVTGNVTVSDSQITDYYNKHKSEYETPAQPESRPVAHILVKSKALADRIYSMLQANPKQFGKLARKYSTDPSSAKSGGVLAGGDVKGRFVKPFEDVAFKLKTHQISKPVHSKFGWHIIEALGPIKPPTKAKPTPLSQVKEAIRQTLIQNKKNQLIQDWQTKLSKRYCPTIAYQAGYAPPPGQDPCKQKSTTTSTG